MPAEHGTLGTLFFGMLVVGEALTQKLVMSWGLLFAQLSDVILSAEL